MEKLLNKLCLDCLGDTLCATCLANFKQHYPEQEDHPSAPIASVVHQAAPLGKHGVSADTVGFAVLARDLFQHEITGQVPEGLQQYVQSSETTEANWYKTLLLAWKAAKHPPADAKEASELVFQTLQGNQKSDVEDFLAFYGLLPSSEVTVAVPPTVVVPGPAALQPRAAIAVVPWPEDVKYELHTLPVESKDVIDGDTILVYINVHKDPIEKDVPLCVQDALKKWRKAQSKRDYTTAKAMHKEIMKKGYKAIDSEGSTTVSLARKYKIRLRGIDAPETEMPYGQESTTMLQSLIDGESLQLFVYPMDVYRRRVADIYCRKGFVQEILLKNGGCWHYVDYDHRRDFAKWEREARKKKVGLWGLKNPEEPWEYRKEHRRCRY